MMNPEGNSNYPFQNEEISGNEKNSLYKEEDNDNSFLQFLSEIKTTKFQTDCLQLDDIQQNEIQSFRIPFSSLNSNKNLFDNMIEHTHLFDNIFENTQLGLDEDPSYDIFHTKNNGNADEDSLPEEKNFLENKIQRQEPLLKYENEDNFDLIININEIKDEQFLKKSEAPFSIGKIKRKPGPPKTKSNGRPPHSNEEPFDMTQVIVNHVKKELIIKTTNFLINHLKLKKKNGIKPLKNVSFKKTFSYKKLEELGAIKIKDIISDNITKRYQNNKDNSKTLEYLMKNYPSFNKFLNSSFKEVYESFFLNGEYPFFDIYPEVDMESIPWIYSKAIQCNLLPKYKHPKVFLKFAREVFLSKLG